MLPQSKMSSSHLNPWKFSLPHFLATPILCSPPLALLPLCDLSRILQLSLSLLPPLVTYLIWALLSLTIACVFSPKLEGRVGGGVNHWIK